MAYNQQENQDLNDLLQEQNPYAINAGDLEGLLDVIAEALIKSPLISPATVKNNQKFIRNGQVQTGQGDGVLALYQKDVEANIKDNLQSVANQINGPFQIVIEPGINDTVSISISGGGLEGGILDITDLVIGEGNPLNVSQFIPLQKQKTNVDIEKAEEFLDTNIFELLPESDSRQARIIRFFDELNTLLPPDPPQFDLSGNDDGGPDGRVDRDENDNWIGSEQYSQDNSISYAQDNSDESNINEEQAFIHRLADTANDRNSTRTIQEIYRRIEPYLKDILEEPVDPQDDRPEYENQSSGYLQFRSPNQGIIIRSSENEFIEGLDPNNPTWLTTDYGGLLNLGTDSAKHQFIMSNPGTGFTITMWVRFLDKASSGTLFNYGNPNRTENAFGFKLETYVLNKNDVYHNGVTFGRLVEDGTIAVGSGYDDAIFRDSDVARFVRLQVREFGDGVLGTDAGLRDSHLGLSGDITLDGSVIGSARKQLNVGDLNIPSVDEYRLLQSTYIPEDFNEWYFICASYNPTINEIESIDLGDPFSYNSDFWLNHVNPFNDNIVANSGYGNKCKVEIISRTDLLRARGFQV